MTTFIADVADPLYDALAALTRSSPPDFVKGISSTDQISDEQFSELQDWASNHAIPFWSTGIGLIDAAEMLVKSAIGNANIAGEKRRSAGLGKAAIDLHEQARKATMWLNVDGSPCDGPRFREEMIKLRSMVTEDE